MRRFPQKTLPEVLGEYAGRDPVRLCAPGHKGRFLQRPELFSAWDVSALPPPNDPLDPAGALARTRRLYAEAYGARDCFLLTGGVTQGVLGMLLSIGEGKRVLLCRETHRSAVSGMALGGHRAAFLSPAPGALVTASAVEAALVADPADAVLLISPDHLGRCADVPAIAAAAHAHGALLLVDAANGAHFPFGETLPKLYPQCADMFCVGAYATLNALTQAALLFMGPNCPLPAASAERALSLLRPAAPAYPMLASLDWALHTARDWDKQVRRAETLARRARAINGLSLEVADDSVFATDPTRLSLNVRQRGISGRAAYYDLLRKNIHPAMCDADRVQFLTAPQDPDDWYERLYLGLCTLPYGADTQARSPRPLHGPDMVLSLREAALSPGEPIPLSEALGRVAAAAVGLSPAGLVTIFPGERIAAGEIAYLLERQAEGNILFGVEEKSKIRVIP